MTTAPPRPTRSSASGSSPVAHRRHEAVLDQDPAVSVLGSGVVDGENVRVGEQGLHARVPYLCRVEVITPRTLDEALRLKSERPDARPIAGGTDLLVELNFDRTRPETILNLAEVPELKGWVRENGSLRLGAALTYTEAMQSGARRVPARARRGLAHGRLAADPEPRHDRRQSRHCLARRRRAPAAPGGGRDRRDRQRPRVRTLPLTEFFLGPKRNALAEDELVLAVRIDPSGQPQTFMKVGPRNAMVIAVCSLAVLADRERGELRAAYGSAGPVPALVTAPIDARADFPDLVADAASPIDDVRGTAAYRRHALRVLTKRALDRVLA